MNEAESTTYFSSNQELKQDPLSSLCAFEMRDMFAVPALGHSQPVQRERESKATEIGEWNRCTGKGWDEKPSTEREKGKEGKRERGRGGGGKERKENPEAFQLLVPALWETLLYFL